MKIRAQRLRRGTPHESYRVTLPKSIIEVKGWQHCDFELEDRGDHLILRPAR